MASYSVRPLTLALPTGASQAREGTFPTIETLLRPGFFREAMRSLQIALFIIYLAHLTLSEKRHCQKILKKSTPPPTNTGLSGPPNCNALVCQKYDH